ncbi:MAG: hypothetical protein WDN29_12580 [Methylovirgula sp.]
MTTTVPTPAAATAGVVKDRDEPPTIMAATAEMTSTKVPAAEMAPAKSTGADAGEAAATEAATRNDRRRNRWRRQILKQGCWPRRRSWLRG